LYAKLDLYNPDLKYSLDDKSTHDDEYSLRKLRGLAHEIALDWDLTKQAIQTMIKEDSKNVFLFAYELSTKLENPLEVFQFSINELESSTEKKGVQFIRGLLAEADKKSPENITKFLKIAHESDSLKDWMIDVYRAIEISSERLNEIVQLIQQGNIPIRKFADISYGKGLDHLEAKDILPLIDELILNHGADGLWVAIQIIVMYQYDKKELDAHLVEKIEQIISSPELLGQEQSGTRDGHLFQRLISMVYKHCGIDDKFAIGLSNIVINLCQIENRTIFSELDSYLQRVMMLLVKEKPIILWEQLSRFFEIATPLEVYYLRKLTGIPLDISDSQSHNRAGILFGIPLTHYDECKKWADVDPEIRSPFLCSFYPVIEIETTANSELVSDSEVPTLETLTIDIEKVQQCRWHPELERLTQDFGHVQEFREALYYRLSPNSWWGSMIPYLEIYLIPLKSWFTHPISEMAIWARDVYRLLENKIEQEQERDQERRI
jgi:hypothetical protein